MVNAQWLFENHLSHLAMEKYLLTRIDHIIQPSSLENAGEILSQTLKHPISDIPIQKNHQGSSTERIALLLQEKEKEQSKESIEELNQQLSLCRFLLELYDAVLVSLIPREAWLVEAIYHQGIPISSIVNEPDCPYGYCDRSTIYRTRKRIIQKSDYFLQTYIPKEVSPCRLEKFMTELKLLREEHCELIRFIQQYTKSSYIAEEILQEAYLEALRCADQIKCPDKLISWLKTVSKRMAISELEKQNRLLRKCLRFTDSVSLTWDEKLVDQIVIRDTLERILKTTPPYYRSVILYRYTYGMSYYQISRNLGISVIAARQINSRIIRRLRNEILNNFKEDNI